METIRLLPVMLLLIGQAVMLFWVLRRFSAKLGGQNSRRFGFGPVIRWAFLQQLLVLALPLGGFYAEAEFRSIKERVWDLASPRKSPFEPFLVEGDPGLVRYVEQQKPMLQRPSFKDGGAFLKWQQSLRQELREKVFDWRKNAPSANVTMRVINRTALENNLRRSFITLPGFDRTPIPAYLFEPAERKKHAAIVVLPGHGQGIVETAGLVNSYQHSVALQLAEAGYVVLTPEFRGFGYLGARIGNEHRLTAYNALLSGSFYKAVLLQDLACAVDMLVSLPHVDGDRIGMTGVSFGGEMSVAYAALDRRIRAVCVQGFGGHVGKCSTRQGVVACGPEGQAACGPEGQAAGLPHYCHLIPGSNQHLHSEDLFLLIHPRPLLAIRGRQDQPKGVQHHAPSELWEMLDEAYSCLGNAELFRFQSMPGGHEYFVKPALQFFHKRLHPAR